MSFVTLITILIILEISIKYNKKLKQTLKYDLQIEVNKIRHCVAVFQSSKVLEKFPVSLKVCVWCDISNEVIPS